jgi:hypothetical protein
MNPPRLIIRQFAPKTMPYQVTPDDFSQALKILFPKLDKVVYAGWARRKNNNGEKITGFFISTGTTSLEARKRFKTSVEFGKHIWQLSA